MVERILVDVREGRKWMRSCVLRYELLCRLHQACRKRGVVLLAFGVADSQVRLVVEGDDDGIRGLLKALKIGTRRSVQRWNMQVSLGVTSRVEVRCLETSVVWAHQAPMDDGVQDPLSSVWTSHRDLMCFRQARFYDPTVLTSRGVEPRAVHRALSGGRLPRGWPPQGGMQSLNVLLRVCASVLGVLPSDRACFRLFAHVAHKCGHASVDIADALALTPRRVRQLRSQEEHMVPVTLVCLADPRLLRVP